MLAYELYKINESIEVEPPENEFPIKKIFYQNGKVDIDSKTLDHYGSKTNPRTKSLQEWLTMPLNTSDHKQVNLPDYRRGTASPNPYVEVYGEMATNKALETRLTLSIGKPSITYTLNLSDGKIIKNGAKTTLRIDRKDYHVGSESLFSLYVASGIINDKCQLDEKTCDKIICKFLEHAKASKPDVSKPNKAYFRLYILPSGQKIEYKQDQKTQEAQPIGTDSFGNPLTCHPSFPTKTAKFLSFDDPAFTINCKQKGKFYINLGIGDKSLEKIYVDSSRTFKIAGLMWTFADVSNPDYRFEDTQKGILTQIFENYKTLLKDKGPTKKSSLKVICRKKNQAKQEVLIDTNLTMDQMEDMFSGLDKSEKIPAVCLEIFIDNSGRNPIWDAYLYVVRTFLAGNKIPKDVQLVHFNRYLKQNRYEWVKSKNTYDAESFFEKSGFCLEHLINRADSENLVSEEFAEKIGRIARLYVDFKQGNGEGDNSLSDILTYSKYDREKLRFILARIGRGIELSKIDESRKKGITDKITSLRPAQEIEDKDAFADLSYFFFKGYYTKEVAA